jgi:hypothetical protein
LRQSEKFLLDQSRKVFLTGVNERFARPLKGVVDMHRGLTPQIDSTTALSHIDAARDEERLHVFVSEAAALPLLLNLTPRTMWHPFPFSGSNLASRQI